MNLIRKSAKSIVDRIIATSERRSPDFIIGGEANPYLRRWWLIPRNPFFNIYLHHFCRSDDDRALHDHPWFNLSILLRGTYIEVTPKGRFVRMAGQHKFRTPWARHRVELFDVVQIAYVNGLPCSITASSPCWTLFITGPTLRVWGFHCPQGFVPWQKFTSPAAKGEIGKGCNQ